MSSWNTGWQRTSSPGIYSSGKAQRIRVRLIDPRNGRLREKNRILDGSDFDEAIAVRKSLRSELEQELRDPPRQRVQEFGCYWLSIKSPLVDPGTYARYADALEKHAFKVLGHVDLRDLRALQVQEWINKELRRGYRVSTIKGWCRVFRTMIQDAMADLELVRDPSRRIRFPTAADREERNALLPDQLDRFLREMRERFPRHYPLVATLALTGLRFCHASGLRWEDFDEKAEILHVKRRQLRGRVGAVTLVKRAPKEYPVSPKLMAVLRAHRRSDARRPRSRGWMFPSRTGGLRCPSSLHKPWLACLRAAGIEGRFTVHGLRRTFVDLARRAHVDGVVTRSLTGHVTLKMHLHYSSVAIDEQRTAVTAVAGLIQASGDHGGDRLSECTTSG